jgi:hypothetical protein
MEKKPTYTVEMVVSVTVESPDDRTLDEETVKSCAMSAISSTYERDVGQAGPNSIPWAKCHAEVCDIDCDIIESHE